MGETRLPPHPVRTVHEFLKTMASLATLPTGLMTRILESDFGPEFIRKTTGNEMLAALINAMQRNTATPTVLRAGSSSNVIPSVAEADIDGRILPGQTPDDLIREVRKVLGDSVEIELLKSSQPYEIDYRTPIFDAMKSVISEFVPESMVVPMMVTGTTDGRFLAPIDVKVYGFSPYIQEPDLPVLELVHGDNERISLSNLRFGVAVLWELISRFVS